MLSLLSSSELPSGVHQVAKMFIALDLRGNARVVVGPLDGCYFAVAVLVAKAGEELHKYVVDSLLSTNHLRVLRAVENLFKINS